MDLSQIVRNQKLLLDFYLNFNLEIQKVPLEIFKNLKLVLS